MAPLISRIWSQITGSSARKEKESFFVQNGSELYKGLVASCEGKYHPFRSFTAEEIISMTNSFKELKEDLGYGGTGSIYKGCFENRQVLIHSYFGSKHLQSKYMINDIVLTSRVSHHKNILKLLGCCLEFEYLTLVFEYPSGGESLYDLMYNPIKGEPLQWKSRLKIAKDIAGILVYLHTAFPTPIISRYLNTCNIFVGESGVAKLFDFSFSISLPPGKTEMEELVCGTIGFIDPSYSSSKIVTTKVDVYSFGVLLLLLLTGREVTSKVVTYVYEHVGESRLKKIVDPTLLHNNDTRGNTEEFGEFQAFLELAERCILQQREDRPEMIDVAKELKRIEKLSSYTALNKIV